MYAELTVVYGVPWTANLARKYDEPEEFGFSTLYSGSAEFFPGYLGEVLWRTDETTNFFALTDVPTQPTDEQKEKVDAAVAALPDEVKKELPSIDVYFIWSTS
jgi:hypothetical protein